MRVHSKKKQAAEQMRPVSPAPQGKATSGKNSTIQSILHLQHTVGNQAVQKSVRANALQRRVTMNVRSQTITPAVAVSMTDAELQQQILICQQVLSGAEPGSADAGVAMDNLTVLNGEASTRASERQQLTAGPPQALVDACQSKVTLYDSVLTNNIKSPTANAARRGLGNFVNFSGISDPAGISVVTLFTNIVQMLPFAGPVASIISNSLVQAAATTIESGITGRSGVSSAVARGEFIASRASDFDEMERTMGQAISSAIARYNGVIQTARSDQTRLLSVYTELDNLLRDNQSLTRSDFDTLANRFEMALYKEYYSSRAHITIYQSSTWGVHSQNIEDMPTAVQGRIARLVGGSALDEVRRWGVPVETVQTRGGPQ
jgi:hypothetical protein